MQKIVISEIKTIIMKIVFFLLAFSTFSFAQKTKSADVISAKKQCTVQMSIEQLTAKNLDFKCSESSNNEIFKIEKFKIKFRGNPALLVQGSSLNDAAKELASISKPGDHVYIFDVENDNSGKKESLKYTSVYIKLID